MSAPEQPKDQWDIERISPVYKATVSTGEVVMTYNNTIVYRFFGAWACANHVYRKAEEGEGGLYVFNSRELEDDLIEHRFPVFTQPFPTDGDLVAYLRWQEKTLEQELTELGGGE